MALIWTFFIFSIISNITKLVNASFENNFNLKQITTTLWSINPKISKISFSIDKIISDLKNWKYPFIQKNWDFQLILNYITKNDLPPIQKLQPYKNFYNFLQKLTNFKQDIFNLLKPWNQYIIVLENIWEVRPNWGFFGSYWILKIFKTWIDIKIYDSYYPTYIKKVKLPIKEKYLQKFAKRKTINFVSPNIRWFTNIDWKNIIDLYQLTFSWEKINWVIFIKSSLFENLDVNLAKKIYEWQFINAAIDLIRWKNLPFKKEIYLRQINNFLQQNKFTILKQILKNRKQITENWDIYVYFPNISKEFENFLEKNNLIFTRKPNCFYFFDHNFWYNKTDRFLHKKIFILNWNKILFETSKNYLCLTKSNLIKLKQDIWNIKIKINYFLSVPEEYFDFIKNLEKKYKINLTQREKNILSLSPYVKNNWIIYRPEEIEREKVNIYNYYISWNNQGVMVDIN